MMDIMFEGGFRYRDLRLRVLHTFFGAVIILRGSWLVDGKQGHK